MASLSSSNESNNKNEAPSEDDILNDEAEERHHLECNIAMLQYSIFMKTEIERRENHLKQISNVQKQYLPYEKMINDIKKLKQAVHANQVLLNNIADDSIYDKHREYLNANFVRCTSKPHQMSKVKTIIEQIVRDWSKEGEVERNECYLPIINELKKRLPIRNNTNNDNNSNVEEDCRVLIPGFGLARILVDIAALGYAVEGNEFDYFMIFASTYFLNGGLAPYSIDIFPYIHSPCNILSKDAHLLKPLKIPDLSTIDVLKENPNLKMRMCSGEFLHVYRNKEYIEHFDCITTCFFVDTAPNIIEYIQIIKQILKPGGYWINLGPLQYHWYEFGATTNVSGIDPRYNESIELSYDELKDTIKNFDFKFINEEFNKKCHYNGLNKMKEHIYNCIFFTVQKN